MGAALTAAAAGFVATGALLTAPSDDTGLMADTDGLGTTGTTLEVAAAPSVVLRGLAADETGFCTTGPFGLGTSLDQKIFVETGLAIAAALTSGLGAGLMLFFSTGTDLVVVVSCFTAETAFCEAIGEEDIMELDKLLMADMEGLKDMALAALTMGATAGRPLRAVRVLPSE